MEREQNRPSLFPMFLKLEGRLCLVVGAGRIAEGKIASLLAAGAQLRVVAPRATSTVEQWAQAEEIVWLPRKFSATDLNGVFLCIAATSQVEVNERVFRQAKRCGALCNAVDDPERCDFYYPAVVRRGDLQIAISTAGRSPALAQRLRRELELQFGPQYQSFLDELGLQRRKLLRDSDAERKRRRMHALASRRAFERFVSGNAVRKAGGNFK